MTISHLHRDHNYREGIIGPNPVFIEGPGEYEVKGVKIIGVQVFHDEKKGQERGFNTIYRIDMDGISIAHLGDLGHKLDDVILDQIDGIDILLIPVGGYYTIGPETAVAVINQIEPSIIIPMHYMVNENSENSGKLVRVNAFLKEMGKQDTAVQNKITVTKDNLPVEPTIIVLE